MRCRRDDRLSVLLLGAAALCMGAGACAWVLPGVLPFVVLGAIVAASRVLLPPVEDPLRPRSRRA